MTVGSKNPNNFDDIINGSPPELLSLYQLHCSLERHIGMKEAGIAKWLVFPVQVQQTEKEEEKEKERDEDGDAAKKGTALAEKVSGLEGERDDQKKIDCKKMEERQCHAPTKQFCKSPWISFKRRGAKPCVALALSP